MTHARFGPDNQTIVYSASWGANPASIFSTRRDSVESRGFGPPGAELLSVSAGGEALVLRRGTLARVALAGGAEREILESVSDASWAPNGKDIAVVRPGVRFRLEFPIGRVLFESAQIDAPRVSPRADFVAFLEHPLRGDSRGWLAVVDLKGKERRLSDEFNSIQGAAWSPAGNEIWFSGTPANASMAIYAVSLSGRQRLVAGGPGDQELQDLSPRGDALLTHWHGRYVLMTLPPGQTTERDLSWLDGSVLGDLSDDGKTLLFSEEGEGAGSLSYSAWLRPTDGSPAVRLGDGLACSLSPDGKWALTVRIQPEPAQLVLLPTGAGEPRAISNDAINHRIAAWFPDGRRVLFAGSERGKGGRLYVQDLDGGAPRAITPEIKRSLWLRRPVSPDGRQVLVFDGERYVLYPVDGGAPVPVPALREHDRAVRWSADGRSLFVHESDQRPIQIFRVDLSTGHRDLLKEVPLPEAAAGVVVLPTADGKSYVCGYGTSASDLYLVEGLK